MLGAAVMLTACAPVQMGAAAIVGNQRITQSTLAANVSDLQAAVAKVPAGQVQLPPSEMGKRVLGWLVQFDVMNRAAEQAGISVTPSQVQHGLDVIKMTAQQYAQQARVSDPMVILLSNGIAPKMLNQLGRYQAQELELVKRANGGKLPTTQAENGTVTAALNKSRCQAAKALNISINPQYGRMDYQQFTIVAGPDVLSKAVGASPAPATGSTPSC